MMFGEWEVVIGIYQQVLIFEPSLRTRFFFAV